MTRNLPSVIEWEPMYTPHTHNLIKDFYIPVLSNTIIANRSIGYFRSSALTAASVGYEKFCDHPDAKMRLIVGLEFTKADHDRILFSDDPEKVEEGIREMIETELTKDMPDFEKSRLAGLSWMLNNEKMEIKFGVMLDQETKKPLQWEEGKWHHKITTFTDESNNSVSINGSINESAQAWKRNGDSFSTSLSWLDGWTAKTVNANNNLFEEIWRTDGWNRHLNVGIFSISDLPEKWKRYVSPTHPKETMEWPDFDDDEFEFTTPSEHESDEDPRWIHQKEAVHLFLADRKSSQKKAPMAAGKQGILCMATGTGKTRTALKIVKKMMEGDEIDKVIITTHKVDLLDQWGLELKDPKRGLLNLIEMDYVGYGSTKQWPRFLHSSSGRMSLLIGRDGFQEMLKVARTDQFSRTLLIVDECHNFRGEKGRKELDGQYQKIPYRLGLSATPANEYSEEASQFLYDEIGPVFFNFDLLDAIKNGILCPFEYHGESYSPTAKEIEKVKQVKRKYEGAKKHSPGKSSIIHQQMLIAMAAVFKSSEGKLPILGGFLQDHTILKRCIIFGPKKKYNEQIKDRLNKMQADMGVRWTAYYGETDSSQLDLYRDGKVEVLLTCKAIAEGIDLEVTNIILLASDGTKLETIQRIGRALRTHGDDQKVARVYDFLRDNADVSADTKRSEWLSELSSDGLKERQNNVKSDGA